MGSHVLFQGWGQQEDCTCGGGAVLMFSHALVCAERSRCFDAPQRPRLVQSGLWNTACKWTWEHREYTHTHLLSSTVLDHLTITLFNSPLTLYPVFNLIHSCCWDIFVPKILVCVQRIYDSSGFIIVKLAGGVHTCIIRGWLTVRQPCVWRWGWYNGCCLRPWRVMISCQDLMQCHPNMAHHILQKLWRGSVFILNSPDSIKQPLIHSSASCRSENWSADIRFVLTEINQTADVENHQFQIRNAEEKCFPQELIYLLFSRRFPGEYFTMSQWVKMCIMCRAAVKKSDACIYTVPSLFFFFFLQPSGKHHCEHSGLKVSETKNVCVCVHLCIQAESRLSFPTMHLRNLDRVHRRSPRLSPSDCNCAVFAELGWGISRAYINL